MKNDIIDCGRPLPLQKLYIKRLKHMIWNKHGCPCTRLDPKKALKRAKEFIERFEMKYPEKKDFK